MRLLLRVNLKLLAALAGVGGAAVVACVSVWGLDAEGEALTADRIAQEVLSRRPAVDFRFRGKLYRLEGVDGKKELGTIEVAVTTSTADTRMVVRAVAPPEVAGTAVLIVQPTAGDPRYYLAEKGQKPVELTSERLAEAFIGSDFSYQDLNPVFYLCWPKRELLGVERVRGQDCYKLALTPPAGAKTTYAKIICWVEKERFAVVKSEAFNADGASVRKFSVSALKKVVTAGGDELWTVKAVEMLWRPPYQFLPSAQKTRLEVTEDEYGVKLPREFFMPETFAGKP